MNKYLYAAGIMTAAVLALVLSGCSSSPGTEGSYGYHSPVAAYEIRYDAATRVFSMRSIDVTPPSSGQNTSGTAGVFQEGNAVFDGNKITATVYIVNNDSVPWTGVQMQAYRIVSGSPVAVETDLGNGWFTESPSYGAWGWIFTSDTAGSAYTIPSGGRSANKVIGFDATSSFSAVVYVYANVPIITGVSGETSSSGITITGYNFSSTSGAVIFNRSSAAVQTWSDNTVAATVPTPVTYASIAVDTGDPNTPYSNSFEFSTVPPLPPTGLSAAAGSAQVSLAWNQSAGAASYNVYESAISGGRYTKVGSATGISSMVTGLTGGMTYYFVVTAVNALGESGYSDQAGATLLSGTPTDLRASAGDAQVSLTWNAVLGAAAYKVYQSADGSAYALIASPVLAGYTSTGLSNGTSYSFTVTAVSAGGESGPAGPVSAVPESASTVTVSGQVLDGTNPIPGVPVSLYVAGAANPTDTVTSDSTGSYSFTYTYQTSVDPVLYVVASLSTGHLASVAGRASNIPAAVDIDELSTVQTMYAVHQAADSLNTDGSITVTTGGDILLSCFASVYNATGDTTSAVFNAEQYTVYQIADGLAAAVQSVYGTSQQRTKAGKAAQSLYSNLAAYSSFTCTVSGSYCTDSMALNGITMPGGNNTIAAFAGAVYEIAQQIPYPLTPDITAGNTLTVNYMPSASGINIPYVTIYINGTPFNLLLDTGATGIMIDQVALTSNGMTLPATSYAISGAFGSSCGQPSGSNFTGSVTYARISTTTSGGLETSPYFPIVVSNCNFQTIDGLDGDFGMGLSPYFTFGYNGTTSQQLIFVPSVVYGFSQNYKNGFLMDLADTFNANGYENAGNGTGTVTFGLNTQTNNQLSGSSVFFPDYSYSAGWLSAYPMLGSRFGTATGNGTDPYLSLYDTGSNFMFLSSNALTDAISGFNPSSMVYNCGGTRPVLGYKSSGSWNILIGGLGLAMYFSTSSGSFSGTSYPTYPAYNGTTDTSASDSLCGISLVSSEPFLFEYYVLDVGSTAGMEDFGLPFLFNTSLYWQAQTPAVSWGIGRND